MHFLSAAASGSMIERALQRQPDPALLWHTINCKRDHDAEPLIALDEIGGAINRINRPDHPFSGLGAQCGIKRHRLLADHRAVKNGLQARCQPCLGLLVSNGNKISR